MIARLIGGFKTHLVGMVIIGLLCGLAALLQQQLQQQAERAAIAEKANADRFAVITHMQGQALQQARSLTELAKTTGDIRSAIGQRDHTIRRLERENDHYKNWAATALPAAAQRLRQRPALTGAAAYQQFLSTAEPLPATRQPADPQRRPDPRPGERRSSLGDLRRQSRLDHPLPAARPPATAAATAGALR
tara:strand:+ start:4907 stop:5479 length:573 start_codon:yes stop_codon:yes gene_type:complete